MTELLAGEKADDRQYDRADGRASFAVPETVKAAKKENHLYPASDHRANRRLSRKAHNQFSHNLSPCSCFRDNPVRLENIPALIKGQ
jgi:hypothetical protein